MVNRALRRRGAAARRAVPGVGGVARPARAPLRLARRPSAQSDGPLAPASSANGHSRRARRTGEGTGAGGAEVPAAARPVTIQHRTAAAAGQCQPILSAGGLAIVAVEVFGRFYHSPGAIRTPRSTARTALGPDRPCRHQLDRGAPLYARRHQSRARASDGSRPFAAVNSPWLRFPG
jgi:hypothetical protein